MILVAGATGVLGSEIVRRLTERGEEVRALARITSAPEKVERLKQLGAEIVRGDLKEPPTLVVACEGTKAVISTVTTILTSQPGDSFEATDGEGTKALIDAAKKSGVKKFVFVSFDTSRAPDAPLVRAKREAEEHLRRSGMDYTILQPAPFVETWLGPMMFADPAAGTAKVYGRGEDKLRYIAVADVAEMAVQSLTKPSAVNATIPFGGPDQISQRDAVRLFEEAYGKKFTLIEVPEETLEAQWSVAANPFEKTFAALMLALARGLGSGVNAPVGEFSMQMTSPRDYVRTLARDSGLVSRREPRDSAIDKRTADRGVELA